MGVDLVAFVMVGVRIPHARTMTEKRLPASYSCKHGEPITPCCPQCGTKWEARKELREELQALESNYRDASRPKMNYAGYHESKPDVIVGYRAAELSGDGGVIDCLALAKASAGDAVKLRELLEPLGLWEGCEFGVWSVAYLSC